ncbi:hypothetical protein P6166_11215 [Stenotrophomonas sp. HITSZ_GD]|uniref:hypothetical protein n=1 Tax=Stenotrophomonas sp. HITSZ_GD TaxID=3037248 RepID=UPI00240DACD2|nr:hypothetical protein [Stenotrophomonas sp. HITSZ_GD]MDG2525923.1 hypothetical protein [Stenotrophomonas sp. HITSZ_GD]
MRSLQIALLIALLLFAIPRSHAQATARPCGGDETPGPACLLASTPVPGLPGGPVFWHIDRFASREAAARAATPRSSIVEAFGATWLFTLEGKAWRAKGGTQSAVIGPLPVQPAGAYTAEYLRSVFAPGTKAPLHVHSGPEAFYALEGDTCLEMPDGMQLGRGPGNTLFIRGGPPMLLMAVGTQPRRGFALILHDAHQPPTTLIHDWQPQGLCEQQWQRDQLK